MLTKRSATFSLYFLSAAGWATLVLLLSVQQAVADGALGGFSPADCSGSECQLTAGTPGYAADSGRSADETSPVRHFLGAIGSRSASSSVFPADCLVLDLGGRCVATGWSETQSSGGSRRQVSPGVIARRVVGQLKLPSPGIRMSPDVVAAEVVRVPVWMWVDRVGWRSLSKTVEVPGSVVTATAVPQRVVWSMGNGDSVSCPGPGTPYSPGFPAASESPDCGYVYRQSSAGLPGEVFTVTATVLWNVTWHGGGRGGRFSGLRTVAQVPVRVTEVQGVVAAEADSI